MGDYLCHWCQSCFLEGLFTLMGGVFGEFCCYSVDPRGANSSLRPPLKGRNVRSVALALSASLEGSTKQLSVWENLECMRPSSVSLKEFIVSLRGWCSVCYRWLTV